WQSEFRKRPRGAKFFIGCGGGMGSLPEGTTVGWIAGARGKSGGSSGRARLRGIVFRYGCGRATQRIRTSTVFVLANCRRILRRKADIARYCLASSTHLNFLQEHCEHFSAICFTRQ